MEETRCFTLEEAIELSKVCVGFYLVTEESPKEGQNK